MNAQALLWCQGEAAERPCPEDRDRSVRACFEEEQPRLLALPTEPFPCEERVIVRAAKTPVVEGSTVLAVHPRSFDRRQQIEQACHIQALVDHKRAGRAHRAIDRLHHAAPSAATFFALAAERGTSTAYSPKPSRPSFTPYIGHYLCMLR